MTDVKDDRSTTTTRLADRRSPLLERGRELRRLRQLVDDVRVGRGATVVISGEPGIGKTSLLAAALAEVADVRCWVGACDDLIVALPRGPLREAVRREPERLRGVVATGDLGDVLDAFVLECAQTPTVFVIEDLHWADDATLDVVSYLSARAAGLALLLVVTVREGEVACGHPAERALACLSRCGAQRISPAPLSGEAVAELAAGSGWLTNELVELTAGNPFFVTEAISTGPVAGSVHTVPATVADAVRVRVSRLGAGTRQALEQLSVSPGGLELELARTLLDEGLADLVEAELHEIIRVSESEVSFRHELARRAIVSGLPALHARRLQEKVTRALRAQDKVDSVRLVHHAVQCADEHTVAAYAPAAARESAAAGAHSQALALYAAALRVQALLPRAMLAEVLDGYAWELHNANDFQSALHHGELAVAIYEDVADPSTLSRALVRLARLRYVTGDTDGALTVAHRAQSLADTTLDRAACLTALGSLQALDLSGQGAADTLRRALESARAAGAADLEALCLNYLAQSLPQLTEQERLAMLRRSIATAAAAGQSEAAARGHTNLVELLYRFDRLSELADAITEGLQFTLARGLRSHATNLEAHGALLELRTGQVDRARRQLEDLVERTADAGMLAVYVVPALGRLRARAGDPAAENLLRTAWRDARRQRLLLGLGYAGTALAEWAWLNDDPGTAAEVTQSLIAIAGAPGAAPFVAEAAVFTRLAGGETSVPTGQSLWHAMLLGDWQRALQGWQESGDQYGQVLARVCCDRPEELSEAVRRAEALGARSTVRRIRQMLRERGMRGPQRSTRTHPDGLTRRQDDVLALLATGMTNAEIAIELVVSVRTVDHHVSAILTKLGVATRREAGRLHHRRTCGPA